MGKQKEVNTSEGFDTVFDTLGKSNIKRSVADLSNSYADDDSGVIDLSKNPTNDTDDDVDLSPVAHVTDTDIDDEVDTIEDNDDQDDSEENDIDDNEEDQNTEPEEGDTETETDDDELKYVSDFFDVFSEKLGWNVENDDKPKSIEDLIDYMGSVIEENSKPQYANEVTQQIDEFVKNGGNLEDLLKVNTTQQSVSELDITDENNQKQVLTEYLKKSGLTQEQINKKLEKYEYAGILEDEATEAKELLKNIEDKEKANLIEEQKKQMQEYKKSQEEFFTNVTTSIKKMDSILGFNVPAKDKSALIDFLFKTDSTGQTEYVKKYLSDPKNLVESAYLVMKGEDLIKSAKRAGETSAVQKFRETLKTNKKNTSKQGNDNDAPTPVWAIGSYLKQNK